MDFAISCTEKSEFCSLKMIVIADEHIREIPQTVKAKYHKRVVPVPKLS